MMTFSSRADLMHGPAAGAAVGPGDGGPRVGGVQRAGVGPGDGRPGLRRGAQASRCPDDGDVLAAAGRDEGADLRGEFQRAAGL